MSLAEPRTEADSPAEAAGEAAGASPKSYAATRSECASLLGDLAQALFAASQSLKEDTAAEAEAITRLRRSALRARSVIPRAV